MPGKKAFAAGADLDELPGAFASAESARAYDDHVARNAIWLLSLANEDRA
jgi:hypothetical protein